MNKKVNDLIAEAEPPAASVAPLNSEEFLALKFADAHATDLRYVAKWGTWLMWNGTAWNTDETRKAFSLSRDLCREAANATNSENQARMLASAKTRAAVLSLAGEDGRLAGTVDQWDVDKWLLNTPGGVIDLRNGKLREHRPGDYMTKITAATPDAACPTPLWSKFIQTVTDNDQDLQEFLGRVFGYSLTGSTEEQSMFFCYGGGANGKGVTINTVTKIMGDYACSAPMETFVESKHDRHPTELAMLYGARLVTATETEKGRHWAEAKISKLTGSDEVQARFMHKNFFEFVPQFKLVFQGNHKPGLRSVNEAIRRRMNMVPFKVTIPEAERDLKLEEKLVNEWPGIMAWIVKGCLQWQKIGLAAPAAVREATEEYLLSEDVIATFIDEACVKDSQAWTSTAALFTKWQEWTKARNEYTGTSKAFTQQMESHHFKRKRGNSGVRGIAGLSILMQKSEPPKEHRDQPKWQPEM